MLDHRYDNVRVSSIMPGSVDTEFSGTPGKPRPADTSWMIAPEDVAEAVSMVLADARAHDGQPRRDSSVASRKVTIHTAVHKIA